MGGDMEEMQPLRACSALFGKEVEDFLLMATVHHVAIESMFNEYDVDGSGSLDVHEVQALAQRLHIAMDAAKVRSHLNLLRGSWNPEPKARGSCVVRVSCCVIVIVACFVVSTAAADRDIPAPHERLAIVLPIRKFLNARQQRRLLIKWKAAKTEMARCPLLRS